MTRFEARLVALSVIVRVVQRAIEGKAGLRRLLEQAALDSARATNSVIVMQEVCAALGISQTQPQGQTVSQGQAATG